LEVLEVFVVRSIAAGLSGPQKPPLSGSTSRRSGWSLTPALDYTPDPMASLTLGVFSVILWQSPIS
jgi:hypothetical protein